MLELTEGERSLIESGVATYAEVVAGKRKLIEAKLDEISEANAVDEWDRTHDPMTGEEI